MEMAYCPLARIYGGSQTGAFDLALVHLLTTTIFVPQLREQMEATTTLSLPLLPLRVLRPQPPPLSPLSLLFQSPKIFMRALDKYLV
jgi:hypothetical protein